MKCNGRILWVAVYALILSLSAGCASLSPINPKQALEERVGNYMQARIDGEWTSPERIFEELQPTSEVLVALDQNDVVHAVWTHFNEMYHATLR